jgi:hypothetical protein
MRRARRTGKTNRNPARPSIDTAAVCLAESQIELNRCGRMRRLPLCTSYELNNRFGARAAMRRPLVRCSFFLPLMSNTTAAINADFCDGIYPVKSPFRLLSRHRRRQRFVQQSSAITQQQTCHYSVVGGVVFIKEIARTRTAQ